jgi:hypothetical protein
MNKICSDKAPLNKREWSVSRCFKKGLSAGFAAGVRKGQEGLLVPQQDVRVVFEPPPVQQIIQRQRVNQQIRNLMIPQNNVVIQFDEPEPPILEPPILEPPPVEPPPPENVRMKINAGVLKQILGKDRYRDFINTNRERAEQQKASKPQEVFDKFGIPDLKLLAEYLLELNPDEANTRTLNLVINDPKIQGNKGIIKTLMDGVIGSMYRAL